MARLEDKENRGLPPPPAATRRSANPWKFSETARKQEPPPEPVGEELIEELLRHAPHDEPELREQEPPPPARQRTGPGLWFLIIAGIVILLAIRVFFEAREDRDWTKLVGPLVLIAFIVHGWWRARQRREADKSRED
ncbi:MAG: hypothetical protein WAW79_07530 [Steroidobacteraceae bacterium]